MKNLRVAILVHRDLVPPPSFSSKREWEGAECKTEFDVRNALLNLGIEIRFVPVFDDLSVIRRAIAEFKPHVAFNLLEEFNGQPLYEHNVVSYLELLGLKYTGCNPRGLMLARDKALAKKVLSYHQINTPSFWIFPLGRKVVTKGINPLCGVSYPLFVKSLNQEGSFGISQGSIVYDERGLRERIEYLHETFEVDVLVETYIEGRELYVSVMGHRDPKTFPVWELYFTDGSFQGKKIATHNVKWNQEYRQKHGIESGRAQPLTDKLQKQISSVCKKAYSALGLSGYARMDLRLTPKNEIFFIEANPNPDIGFKEDFSDAVAETGLSYENLIYKIVKQGIGY